MTFCFDTSTFLSALIILLLCAVVIGLFYWNGQKKMQNDEGYLVKYSLPNKKLEVIVHGI